MIDLWIINMENKRETSVIRWYYFHWITHTPQNVCVFRFKNWNITNKYIYMKQINDNMTKTQIWIKTQLLKNGFNVWMTCFKQSKLIHDVKIEVMIEMK